MDVRADIFVNIPKFLEEINSQLSSIQVQSPQPSHVFLAAIQPSQDTCTQHTAQAQSQILHHSTQGAIRCISTTSLRVQVRRIIQMPLKLTTSHCSRTTSFQTKKVIRSSLRQYWEEEEEVEDSSNHADSFAKHVTMHTKARAHICHTTSPMPDARSGYNSTPSPKIISHKKSWKTNWWTTPSQLRFKTTISQNNVQQTFPLQDYNPYSQ